MAESYQSDKEKALKYVLGVVLGCLVVAWTQLFALTKQHDIAIAKIETWQEAFVKQKEETDRVRLDAERDLKTRMGKIEDGVNEILKYQRNKNNP